MSETAYILSISSMSCNDPIQMPASFLLVNFINEIAYISNRVCQAIFNFQKSTYILLFTWVWWKKMFILTLKCNLIYLYSANSSFPATCDPVLCLLSVRYNQLLIPDFKVIAVISATSEICFLEEERNFISSNSKRSCNWIRLFVYRLRAGLRYKTHYR